MGTLKRSQAIRRADGLSLSRGRGWCEREGHGVVASFSDAALSGASIHGRSGLNNLIAGAVERHFDVVESFNRVARPQSELAPTPEMFDQSRIAK